MKTLLLAIMTGMAMTVPNAVHAATFTVNSTHDDTDTVPGDGVCMTVAGTCTLRAAILEANALAGADTISLPAGRYKLSITGVNEESSVTGDLDITDDVSITGAGEAVTIIDAGHIDRAVDVHAPAQVALSHLTIANGAPPELEKTTAENGTDGGGMLNLGTITLTNVTFFHNRAGRNYGSAGGLDNLGTADLTHVTFLQNRASDAIKPDDSAGWAGGMWNNFGTATLTDVTFRANRAGDGSRFGGDPSGGEAGGFLNDGDATLTDVTFSLNRAGNGKYGGLAGAGGAIENWGTTTLTRVNFYRNRAGNGGGDAGDGGDGGGLGNYASASLADCTFVGNRAGRVGPGINGGSGGYGGAIYNLEEATIALTRVTLDRNRAGDSFWGIAGSGGGMFSAGTSVLTNVTVTRNRAGSGPRYSGGDGGGLSLADATLTNVTIVNNRAGKGIYGGGGNQIAVTDGTTTLTNSIIAGQKNCAQYYSAFTSLGHNLDSGSTCALTGPGDLSDTDPRLERLTRSAELQNHGGFTPTLALLPGSPAIDAGDNTACPATDQRGVTRPQGTACDIGAYEFQP